MGKLGKSKSAGAGSCCQQSRAIFLPVAGFAANDRLQGQPDSQFVLALIRPPR